MAERSSMGIAFRALGSGASMVSRNRSLVVLIWLSSLLFALVGAVGLESEIREAIDDSGWASELRGAIDLVLLEEMNRSDEGLISTVTPIRLSAAAVLANLESWLLGTWATQHRGLIAWGVMFILFWIFLQGGLIEHLVHRRNRLELKAYFAASGTFFARFLRLGLLTALIYYWIYRLGRWWMTRIDRSTLDVTSERDVLILYSLAVLGAALLIISIHLAADYAKIALVRSRRRSAVLAFGSGLVQVVRHPLQTYGVYLVVGSSMLAIQGLYVWVMPSPDWRSVAALVAAFVLGQIYLLSRWALRVTRLAAQVRLVENWSGARG